MRSGDPGEMKELVKLPSLALAVRRRILNSVDEPHVVDDSPAIQGC